MGFGYLIDEERELCYITGYISDKTDIIIPDMIEGYKVTNIGINKNKNVIAPSFYGNEKITSVIIPNNVKSIEYFEFNKCINIKSIEIPDSVTQIGNNVFGECRSLTKIDIPGSLAVITEGAFFNCSALDDVKLNEGVKIIENMVFQGCGMLENIELPESLEAIGKDAFRGCLSLEEIVIPSGIIYFGGTIFQGCDNLKSIYFTGDAPDVEYNPFADFMNPPTLYYREGTLGWDAPVWQNAKTAVWVE